MQQDELIDVKVIWPDGHSVPVKIRLRPQRSNFAQEGEAAKVETLGMTRGRYFDGAELDSFGEFLERITRGQAGLVEAWCYDHLRDELLVALRITGPIAGPVDFPLENDG